MICAPLASYQLTLEDDPTLKTISLTLYIQGCTRRCEGCHNPELQEFDESKNMTMENIKDIIDDKCRYLCRSVCFCGGDWLPTFEEQLNELVDYCNDRKLKTILYTGERYEDIPEYLKNKINIIISDPFDINLFQKNKFPASSNQRVWVDGEQVDPETFAINIKRDKNIARK